MKLSYLFECHFTDGTFLQQTEEDVSKTTEGKSAYYDVLQRKDEVASFGLFSDKHTYAVDLQDGHFEVDGAPFFLQTNGETVDVAANGLKLELIYFRRHVHVTVVGRETGPEDLDHTVEYFIGWSAIVDEKPIQQTISIR